MHLRGLVQGADRQGGFAACAGAIGYELFEDNLCQDLSLASGIPTGEPRDRGDVERRERGAHRAPGRRLARSPPPEQPPSGLPSRESPSAAGPPVRTAARRSTAGQRTTAVAGEELPRFVCALGVPGFGAIQHPGHLTPLSAAVAVVARGRHPRRRAPRRETPRDVVDVVARRSARTPNAAASSSAKRRAAAERLRSGEVGRNHTFPGGWDLTCGRVR